MSPVSPPGAGCPVWPTKVPLPEIDCNQCKRYKTDMKICSLLPSGTEILYALGLDENITGVSDLCDYPPQAQAKPVVARSKVDASVLSSDQVEAQMQRLLADGEDPYELDGRWLQENAPDVVLTQDVCYFCEVDAGQVLDSVQGMLSPPRVVVLQPKTLAGVFESILEVGDACGVPKAAADLVSALERRVARVSGKLSASAKKPRVFSLEGINPIVTGGHWVPDLLLQSGGSYEMYHPGCLAARPRWEDICAWAPEKLFLDLCSSDLERNLREVPWLAAQDGWRDLPAVRAGEVYLLDHVYFSRPGPRIVIGLEILAQLSHPQLFDGNIPQDAVLKLDAELAQACPPQEIAACFKPHPLSGF